MSGILYIGIDLHEKESQLAIFEQDGALVEEKRLPTGELASFLSSLPGEKHVAMESVGFVYPVYDRLSSLQDCRVTVANVNKLQLISRSTTKRDSADARSYWVTCSGPTTSRWPTCGTGRPGRSSRSSRRGSTTA